MTRTLPFGAVQDIEDAIERLHLAVAPSNERTITENRGAVRGVVDWLVETYQNSPNKLKQYFEGKKSQHEDRLLRGAATAAYAMITGDFQVISGEEYGGLGIRLRESPSEPTIDHNQLWFAELRGEALYWGRTKGHALKYAHISGDALSVSHNSGCSLEGATIIDDALRESQNSQSALASAQNGGHSLARSVNLDGALCDSTNAGNCLQGSLNLDDTLWRSENIARALEDAQYGIRALEDSEISSSALKGATKLSAEKSFRFQYNDSFLESFISGLNSHSLFNLIGNHVRETRN